MGITLVLKAAGQKVGDMEVQIRYVRESSRACKAGARDVFGYNVPDAFNLDLVADVVSTLNRTVHLEQSETPYHLFTGQVTNYLRDFRVSWGEIIIVKRPKGVSSDLKSTGQWAVVVRRFMDGTGVLKVYLIESKRYGHRIKFKRAKVPQWVVDRLNEIQVDARIGFEDSSDLDAIRALEGELPELEWEDSLTPLTDTSTTQMPIFDNEAGEPAEPQNHQDLDLDDSDAAAADSVPLPEHELEGDLEGNLVVPQNTLPREVLDLQRYGEWAATPESRRIRQPVDRLTYFMVGILYEDALKTRPEGGNEVDLKRSLRTCPTSRSDPRAAEIYPS